MWDYYPEHPIESFRVKRSWNMWPLVPVSPMDVIDKENIKQWGVLDSPTNFGKLTLQEKWEVFWSKLLFYLGSHMIQVDKMMKESKKLEWEVIKFLDYLVNQWALNNIYSFSFEKWICTMELQVPPSISNKKISLNLARLFTQNGLDTREFERAMKAKEDLSKLRESLETESLFGWVIVVSYEQKEIGKKALWWALWTLAVFGSIDTIEYWVRKILFRDESGKMQEVDLKIVKNIMKWVIDKTRINSLLFKVMQSTGRVYNGIRSGFTDITTLGIDRATEKVRLMKRADIEAGRMMTDAEFETEKIRVISEIARTPRWALLAKSGEFLTASTKILQWIWAKAIHYVFWWVFFQEYQKNSYDIANAYKGIAETGLFFTGANLGSRVAPGVWKMPAWLIGGGLAILGWHTAGGAIWLDKRMWRMMPERVAGDGSKSLLGHILSAGATNDGVDKMSADLGIPGTRWGAVIYNPIGKDGIMPNVDFARTHIDFGVDSREYLQSRIGGTDTHWNQRMDEYIRWSTDAVMRILWEYDNSKGYFSGKNGDKNKLLRERLRPIFDSEDGKNKRNILIVDDCIDYIANKATKMPNLTSRKEMIGLFLGNYGNILKIDEASLNYDEKLIERDKTIIDGHTANYLSLLPAEKRASAEKVFQRLQKWEVLVDGKLISRRGDMIGQEVQVWKANKKELSVYEWLIDDPTPAKSEWYELLGFVDHTLKSTQESLKWVDTKYWTSLANSASLQNPASQDGIWRNMRIDLLSSLAITDPNFAIQTTQLRKTLITNPSFQFNLPSGMRVRTPNGEFPVKEIFEEYRTIVAKLSVKKSPPTQWDVFTFLLTTQTEYREQKRYIDTQKSIWYANKWKLF
jgi:hypothetical protein